MTEPELVRKIVDAAVMASLRVGEMGPVQPALDAVRKVLTDADVRLTLPYRLTPPAGDEWFVSPSRGGGWAAVARVTFDDAPEADHSRRILRTEM